MCEYVTSAVFDTSGVQDTTDMSREAAARGLGCALHVHKDTIVGNVALNLLLNVLFSGLSNGLALGLQIFKSQVKNRRKMSVRTFEPLPESRDGCPAQRQSDWKKSIIVSERR